jgi:hypothetical protein
MRREAIEGKSDMEQTQSTRNRSKIGFWYTLPAIVLLIIFIWPAGIYCYKKRMSMGVTAAASAANVGITFGILNLLMGLLMFTVESGDRSLDIGTSLYFLIPGLFFFLTGINAKRFKANFVKYERWIEQEGLTSIDGLASVVGKPYAKTRSDLQKMIKKGVIRDAFIDDDARELVFVETSEAKAVKATPAVQVSSKGRIVPQEEAKNVRCASCGANNKVIPGRKVECEYCGTVLR